MEAVNEQGNQQNNAQDLAQAPEPINAMPRITISAAGMEAVLTISPPLHGGSPVSAEGLQAALAGAGVTYGINEEMAASLVKSPKYNESFVIATGTAAIDGVSARLEYQITLGRDIKPKENPDGTVDYKDLGIIQNVMENEVLCLKIPPEQGTPGCNVLGVELKAKPGRDLALPMGKNTKISEDQLQLLAACDGQVDLVGDKLQVLNTYTVNGDVCNATGNIDFVGNLIIRGNVLAGFTAQASGNITVQGSVEDATVIAGGNIVLAEGIHGAGGRGKVQAGGFLKSKYIQSGNVKAGGDVESTFIQHSTIQCGGNVNLLGTKGRLAGGRVVARNSINAAFVGGISNTIPTVLEVGNNPETAERFRDIEKKVETLKGQMESLSPAISTLGGLEAAGSLSGDRLEALVQARNAYQLMSENLEVLQHEMVTVKEEMETLGYGTVNVKQAAYPGVKIVVGSEQLLLETQYDHTTFMRGASGVSFVPYSG